MRTAPAVATERRDLERVALFSDAVFAIAITLLVIDLRVPLLGDDVSNRELTDAVLALRPQLFAYALSVTVIGMYWHAHWRRFRYLERVDGRLIALNLTLLGLIALIPFPTALIGEYGDLPIAVVIYALSVAAPGLLGPLTWLYARRGGLAARDLPARELRLATLRGLVVPVVTLGSLLLLPFASTRVVELAWCLVIPLQFLIGRSSRKG